MHLYTLTPNQPYAELTQTQTTLSKIPAIPNPAKRIQHQNCLEQIKLSQRYVKTNRKT